MLNYDIVVSEFELQLRYYIHFWTNNPWEKYEPLSLFTPLLFFYKDDIDYLTKVDM